MYDYVIIAALYLVYMNMKLLDKQKIYYYLKEIIILRQNISI